MNRAAMLALTPLSIVYRAGVRARNHLYRRDFLQSLSVEAPVISVGNLTTGGTGKTPLVEWIAARLSEMGIRACVLTRGYGRKSSGRVVVSDYSTVLSNADEAGDEPLLLAQNLCGRVAVVCDSDRVAAAQWAKENLQSEVFILDDGFQHQRIKRQLNILTLDATNPWGNGRLIPAGILREPIDEIRRADCIVITRADEAEDLDRVRAQVAGLAKNARLFTSRIKLAGIKSLDGTASAEFANQSPQVAAFCAIGNPESFLTLLRSISVTVTNAHTFRDHHRYSQSDIDLIVREARAARATVLVTTAKDAVKIRSFEFALPCHVIHTSIEIDDEAEFLNSLNGALTTTG